MLRVCVLLHPKKQYLGIFISHLNPVDDYHNCRYYREDGSGEALRKPRIVRGPEVRDIEELLLTAADVPHPALASQQVSKVII